MIYNAYILGKKEIEPKDFIKKEREKVW